jgi:hypothetical protein
VQGHERARDRAQRRGRRAAALREGGAPPPRRRFAAARGSAPAGRGWARRLSALVRSGGEINMEVAHPDKTICSWKGCFFFSNSMSSKTDAIASNGDMSDFSPFPCTLNAAAFLSASGCDFSMISRLRLHNFRNLSES